MTRLSVRVADTADTDALIRLRLSYFQSQMDRGLLDEWADVGSYVCGSTAGLVISSRARVLVAECDAGIVGYALASFRVVPGALRPAICSIDEVFVLPDSRGAGLARKIVSDLLGQAAERNVDRVQIRALSGNPDALSLWKKLGFVENVIILEYAGSPLVEGTEKLCGG